MDRKQKRKDERDTSGRTRDNLEGDSFQEGESGSEQLPADSGDVLGDDLDLSLEEDLDLSLGDNLDLSSNNSEGSSRQAADPFQQVTASLEHFNIEMAPSLRGGQDGRSEDGASNQDRSAEGNAASGSPNQSHERASTPIEVPAEQGHREPLAGDGNNPSFPGNQPPQNPAQIRDVQGAGPPQLSRRTTSGQREVGAQLLREPIGEFPLQPLARPGCQETPTGTKPKWGQPHGGIAARAQAAAEELNRRRPLAPSGAFPGDHGTRAHARGQIEPVVPNTKKKSVKRGPYNTAARVAVRKELLEQVEPQLLQDNKEISKDIEAAAKRVANAKQKQAARKSEYNADISKDDKITRDDYNCGKCGPVPKVGHICPYDTVNVSRKALKELVDKMSASASDLKTSLCKCLDAKASSKRSGSESKKKPATKGAGTNPAAEDAKPAAKETPEEMEADAEEVARPILVQESAQVPFASMPARGDNDAESDDDSDDGSEGSAAKKRRRSLG